MSKCEHNASPIRSHSFDELTDLYGAKWGGAALKGISWVDPLGVNEPASDWTSAANDTQLHSWRRSFAIVQYFMRHAVKRSFSSILADDGITSWFEPENVRVLDFLSGPPLFDESRKDTTHCYLQTAIDTSAKTEIFSLVEPHLGAWQDDEVNLRKAFSTKSVDDRYMIVEITGICRHPQTGDCTIWMHDWNKAIYRKFVSTD